MEVKNRPGDAVSQVGEIVEKRLNSEEQKQRDLLARTEEFQRSEAKRKHEAHINSPRGMREVLDRAKNTIVGINHEARNHEQETASWTDDRGKRRSYVGPSFTEIVNSDDLLVRSNRRSIDTIYRACRRAIKTIDDLIDVLRTVPKAMPENLEAYLKKIISEIPPLSSIQMEIRVAPKLPAKSDPDTANKE